MTPKGVIHQPASRGLVRVIAGLHSDDGMLMAHQRLLSQDHPQFKFETSEVFKCAMTY